MRLILLLFLVFAVSCVTGGRLFRSDISWIKKDKTDKEDVKMLLGEPFMVGSSGSVKTWTYGYYRYGLFSKNLLKEIKFYWNKNTTVNHFVFNSNFPSDIVRQ